MKRLVLIAGLIGLVTAIGANAADAPTNAPPPAEHRPMAMNLLPPRVLNALALTADQKTKYDALDASFKKDAADLRAKSGESGTRQEFRELHRSYLDKVRAFLTNDQKEKLQTALEHARSMRRGENTGSASPAPAGNN